MVPSIVLQDLRPNEAIVYEAKKSTQNQLSEVLMIPFSIILCCCMAAAAYFLRAKTEDVIMFSLAILAILINCIIELRYKVYLSNQRIILLNKFTSKITSFELDEIDTFDVIHDKRSKYILIGKKRKSTIIRNIKVDELEAEFKKLRPDFKPKGFSLF